MPTHPSSRGEARVHRLFQISLYLKAAHSVLEILGGLALAVVSQEAVLQLANRLTHAEVFEDPHDWIANYILRSAQNLSVDQKFAASFFLLSHGIIKLFLIIAVLRRKSWAYPAFMLALGLLISYQTYRLSHIFSPGLFALTILDAIVLVLAWHEYRFALKNPSSVIAA
jgi:uncharacterized membrane protein